MLFNFYLYCLTSTIKITANKSNSPFRFEFGNLPGFEWPGLHFELIWQNKSVGLLIGAWPVKIHEDGLELCMFYIVIYLRRLRPARQMDGRQTHVKPQGYGQTNFIRWFYKS